jgi:hypothetical protein
MSDPSIPQSPIPAARADAVRRALSEAFPGQVAGPFERMAWGASAAGVFRFRADGRDWALRLDGPPDGFRDPARQHACHRIAAAAGVAPELIWSSAADGLSISAFIAGGEPPADRTDRLLAQVEAVRRLHAAPLFPPLLDYMDAMDAIVGQFQAAAILPPDALGGVTASYRQLAGAYPRPTGETVSSHNDLNPSNLLYAEGRAWLLDWEAAFAADRFVDLAAIANFHGADEAETEQLLNAYFDGEVDDARRNRFALMRRINRIFYGVMLLNAAARERPGLTLGPAELDGPGLEALQGQMTSLAIAEGKIRFGWAFLKAAQA